MKNVFFMSSWVLKPVRDLLHEHKINVEQTFDKAMFPKTATSKDDAVISWACIRRMFRIIEEEIGIIDFGFDLITKVKIHHISHYLNYIAASSATVEDALKGFIELNNDSANNAEMYFENSPSGLWFCFSQRQYSDTLFHTFEQMFIATFIEIVRYYTASEWLPKEVGLTSDIPSLIKHDYVSKAQLYLNHSSNRILVEQDILNKAPKATGIKRSDLPVYRDDIIGELTLVLTPYLQDFIPTLPQAALITGVSERSLQRYLHDRRLTYRKLIEILRLNKAKQLLKESRYTISVIAESLHYNHYNNFSRAFRAATSMSPSQYRIQHS